MSYSWVSCSFDRGWLLIVCPHFMFSVRNLRAVSLLLGLLLCSFERVAASEVSLGPLFQEFKLTLYPGDRTEAAGPLYYQQEITEENDVTRVWAAPPIFSYLLNEHTDYEQ